MIRNMFANKNTDTKLTMEYNYFLSFNYIPKALYAWWYVYTLFETALCFESIATAYPKYKPLVSKTEVVKSGFNLHPDIELYFITIPNTKTITEVGLACIAVNRKSRGYLYFTAEYSFNGYAVCNPDEVNNHNNTGLILKDGAEFAKYCYEQAMEKLSGSSFAHF